MPHRVLVVDDEASIRESLSDVLTDDGLAVTLASDGRTALESMSREVPDVILADVRMPELDGLGLLRAVRARDDAVDVVLMTAFDDMPTVAAAMREGAADFLTKPLDLHELRRVLRRVFDDRQTRLRARQTPSASDGIEPRSTTHPAPGTQHPAPSTEHLPVGRDPKMIDIYKVVGQVAASRTNVLIRGESGTGKELIARAIHDQSPSSGQPFVAVNCSALPPALLESELFGHVRGAFTGAVTARRGRFALAGRGTIFLDEIGDTTADFQTKLLRVLQQQEFYPVGAERPERTEARVIAATHRPLEEMIAKGLFREDLYYRLRVVEITVPPLRDRPGDLRLLIDHLVERASTALGRPLPVLAAEAFDAIRHHRWPGNVRELENCLRRAVVLTTGDVIRAEHLGIGAVASESPAHLPSLAELEREHVARVMTATRGHKARAAQILGVSRPRLNRLLQQYGLE